MKNPICPKCGYPIIDKFTIEVEVDFDGAVELVEGECMNCETEYRYENVYTFSHARNIRSKQNNA
jgi:RNase P subunit RPR2